LRKTYKTNASGQIQAELVGSLAKLPVDIQATQTKELLVVTNDSKNLTVPQIHTYFGEDGFNTGVISQINRTNALYVGDYKELKINVINNYDIGLTISVFDVDHWGNSNYLITTLSVGAGVKIIIDSTTQPVLKTPISYISIRVTTITPPTTGAVSFSVEGQ